MRDTEQHFTYMEMMIWELAVLDLVESGRQIGEKRFVLLTADQKKKLVQFVLNHETNNVNPTDNLYLPIFQVGRRMDEATKVVQRIFNLCIARKASCRLQKFSQPIRC